MFSYDAASRVTQEALNNTWSVSYGYDTAGNRTSVNDGTIDKTIGYGVGNRETSVSGGIDPLGYDYKGNVISRMTLDGTKTYHYGWDAFDRLTSATQMWSGGATVGYDYDAMGRLLRRAKASAAGTSTTLNYWLGLNKLAEERIVDDGSTAVVRPDSEASYPEANGWGFYDIGWDFTLQYDEDSVRGQVLTLAAIGGAASMIVGDDSGENYNGNATAWAAQGRRQLGFWFKNDDATPIEITVFGRASSGYGTLVFDTGTGTDYADSGNGCYVYYLGNANRFPTMNDGNWHYIELDLGAYQKQFSGVSGALTHVDGLAFTLPEDCQIQLDDIILSAGALERSYGLIPGAKIKGCLGAQTGSTGARDVNTQTQCVSAFERYYYHFSDLGTVMATSNASGSKLGVYEPDTYGNYNCKNGDKPDYSGMTSKWFDPDSELSYYGFRWYDHERGRWMSKEPYGRQMPNLYALGSNSTLNGFDYDGLEWKWSEDFEDIEENLESLEMGLRIGLRILQLMQRPVGRIAAGQTLSGSGGFPILQPRVGVNCEAEMNIDEIAGIPFPSSLNVGFYFVPGLQVTDELASGSGTVNFAWTRNQNARWSGPFMGFDVGLWTVWPLPAPIGPTVGVFTAAKPKQLSFDPDGYSGFQVGVSGSFPFPISADVYYEDYEGISIPIF